MSGDKELIYALDFGAAGTGRREISIGPQAGGEQQDCIPRIARLMALAIRFEGLIREERVRDYAELARRGRVTVAKRRGGISAAGRKKLAEAMRRRWAVKRTAAQAKKREPKKAA